MRPAWGIFFVISLVMAGCVAEDPPSPAPDPTPVAPPPPDFTISWDPDPPIEREGVAFRLTSDPAATVRAVHWSFDDGTSTRDLEPTHGFRAAGHYWVNATVNGDAWSAKTQALVTVYTEDGQPPDSEPPPAPANDPAQPAQPPADDPPSNQTANSTSPPPPESHGYNGFDGEPDDCGKLVPPGPFDISAGPVLGYSPRVLDIVLLVDSSFQRVHGDAWLEAVTTIARLADEVYQRELQLRVEVIGVIPVPTEYLDLHDTTTTGLGSDESQAVLDQSRRFMDDHFRDLDRDLVYTLVGAEIAGSIAGQAECIGGAKFKDAAYGWGEADDLEDSTLFVEPLGDKATATKIILHEMAHILGAHHHYANCVEHAPSYEIDDALGTCGMMFNDVGLVGFHFSTLNKMAIRGWAEAVDL